MTIVDDFNTGVDEALAFGQQIRIKYYNAVDIGGYYDDYLRLTQSGNDYWTSGVVLPINSSRGSSDVVLLEQGKVLTNDSKLYIRGIVGTSGIIKVGLGSPVQGEYSLLSEGVIKWDVNQTAILKKMYIRFLPLGSLNGEYN